MAEGSQDRIDIALGADTSGLDDAERRSLAFVDRISETLGAAGQKLPALDLNVGPLAQTLRQAGGDVSRFFADLQQLGTAGADARLSELAHIVTLTGLQFRATSDEGRAFEAVVRDIAAAQARLRQTGSLLDVPALGGPGGGAPPPPPPPPTKPTLLASQDDTRLAQNAEANAAAVAHLNAALQQSSTEVQALSVDTRAAVEVQRRFGEAASQAATGLSVQARAAEASVAATAAAASAGAGPLAAAALGAVAAANTLAAAETRADAGTRTWAAGLAIAERQLVALRAAEDAAATGSGRVTAGFAGATEQRAELDAVALATAKAAGETEKGTRAFGEHEKAGRRAATALGILATESVGATGPVGRLAESVLLFSGGEIAIAGVAAAVLVAVKAYEFFTTASREVRAENDRLVVSLKGEADSALPAVERAHRGVAAAIDAEGRARRDLNRQILLGGDPNQKGFSLSPIEDELARRAKERLNTATRAGEQAQKDETRAARDFQDLNVQTLAQSITLRQADAFQIRQAQGLLVELQRQEHDVTLTVQRRNEARQQELTLATALRDEAQATAIRSAAGQAIAGDLAATQQGIQGRQQALQAANAQELLTQDEFFRRRRALAVAAERADVTALAGRLSSSLGQSSDDPNVQRGIVAQSAELARQIELRRSLLGIQLQQVDAEEQAAKQALLLRSGIGFITSSGVNLGSVFAAQVPDFKLTLKPRVDLTDVEADVAQFQRDTPRFQFDNRMEDARITGIALAAELDQINLKLRDIGNANINTHPVTTLAQDIHDTVRGLEDVAGAAHNVGLIGDQAAGAIDSVLKLGDAIGSVVENASTGNILGLIGAGIGAVSSIGSALGIGKSAAEVALEHANRENTAALHEATRAYQASQGRFQGAGGIREQQDIVGRVLGSPDVRQAIADKDLNEFRIAVEATGISLDDFREIARASGVTLVEDHHLVANGAQVLAAQLRIAAEATTHFGTSISERQTVLETQDKLGIGGRSTDPEVSRLQRDREIQLQGLHLPDQEEARIRALDLSTAQGRADFLKFEQSLFQRALNGQLTPEQLGAFTSVTELNQSIMDAADGLNGFTDATAQASRALQNVPDINRLDELTFQSRGPVDRPGDGASLPLHRTDINPPIPGIDTRGTVTTPAVPAPPAPPSRVNNYFNAPVQIIVQGTPDDPAATARAVRDEWNRTILASEGDGGV